MADPEITSAEVEGAFPWIADLPQAAADQLVAIIDDYRLAAAIYARQSAA